MVSLAAVERSRAPYARLLRVIRKNDQITEGTAFRSLYGESGSAQGTPIGSPIELTDQTRLEGQFRKTKSRLKMRLLNTLFVLDLDGAIYSEYSQSLFRINRMVFLTRVLGVLGARMFSVSIAKGALAEAMTIEEWSCAMEFLVTLRADAAQRGDLKAHRLYQAQFEHCLKLLASEQNAAVCVERMQIAFAKSGGEKPAHAVEAEEAASVVGDLARQFPSFKLSSIALRLRTFSVQIRMDYAASIELCDEALALLERYPQFRNRSRRAEHAHLGLVAAVQLRNSDAARKYIAECEACLNSKEDNWFTFKEFQFLHLMRELSFREAQELVKVAISNPRYDIQTEAVKDKWGLFRLYAEYLNGDRVPVTTPDNFSVLVPSFTGDKSGLNTAMIILHILLLAKRGQFGELRDRIDFIRGYRKRHLKGAENSQANRFFKLLELIESCDLNYHKIVRKARVLIEELNQSEMNEPIQGEQILLYTWVWNRLMEYLREYRPLHSRRD